MASITWTLPATNVRTVGATVIDLRNYLFAGTPQVPTQWVVNGATAYPARMFIGNSNGNGSITFNFASARGNTGVAEGPELTPDAEQRMTITLLNNDDNSSVTFSIANDFTEPYVFMPSNVSETQAWADGITSQGQTVTVTLEVPNRPATGQPTITGSTARGNTLTAGMGDIADEDGLPDSFPGDYTFQWLRGGTAINGATNQTYTTALADVGERISVRVSFLDGAQLVPHTVSWTGNCFKSSNLALVAGYDTQLPTSWIVGGATAYIAIPTATQLQGGGVVVDTDFSSFGVDPFGGITVRLSSIANVVGDTPGPELTSAIQSDVSITFESGSNSLTVTGITDASEPYYWTPTNSAEVIAFYNALTHGDSITVTIDDNVTPVFESVTSTLTAAITNNAPVVSSITATPTTIDHAGTTALAVVASDPNGDAITYSWTSSVGGTFSDMDSATTNWTAPSSETGTLNATLSCTLTSATDNLQTVAQVQVTVREQAAQPVALGNIADRTNMTGETIDVTVGPEATGGRPPYTYMFANLPPDLGNVARRVSGQLVSPVTNTVTVTVEDANGDTDTSTFTWTVTGDAITPPANINVRIDWGNSFFSSAHADVTGRLRSGINCWRGRNVDSVILGKTQAGQMRFQLDNSDGLYDLDNTASALFGLIKPGIRVQLRNGGAVLWTGILDSIPTVYDDTPANQHRAHVTAYGIWETLHEADVNVGSTTPQTTVQAFCDTAESLGIAPAMSGTGWYTMNRWWENRKGRDAMVDIEDTEGGFIFENKTGGLTMQSRGHRAAQSVSANFSGVLPLAAGETQLYSRPRHQVATKDVFNRVIGYVREFEQETAQTVLRRTEAVPVALGATVILTSDYEGDGAVLSVDTPVATTDYTANQSADGTGTNATSDITVAVSIGDFNEVNLSVTYPITGGTQPSEVFLTFADIKGTVLTRLFPDKVTAISAASDVEQARALELRETWINDRAGMTALANHLLGQLASSEVRVDYSFIVYDWSVFTDLELSDKVRLRMPTYTDDLFIESIALNIPLAGANPLPICTIQGTLAT